ncbi:WD40 repeat domain-containing protein [Williamsia serinedens]|uniref:WD40 repeat n=1 Tax=Williamsia serinedens TaxID=391736 RepID=A0ABT1H7U1_9NOCA|nr:WD40 repeat domain-containing protein [Williamsia serinedens]MCP2161962.1 WD40 repeat [Williamsia serinedens]
MGAGACDPFAERLTRLIALAGSPTLAKVSAAANRVPTTGRRRAMTPQRISDWRRGRHLPADFPTLEPVLVVLIAAVDRSRPDVEPEIVSLGAWREFFSVVTAPESTADGAEGRPTIPAGRSPYRGLAEYTADDHQVFHGRRRAVEELVGRIRAVAADRAAPAVLALTAPSAAGKSSLLSAGLIGARALDDDGPTDGATRWRYLRVELGADPGAQIRDAVSDVVHERTVLVVDRLEMILGEADASRRRAFADAVTAAATGGGSPRVVVVVTVRADLFGACLRLPGLGALLAERSMILPPMSDAELREVITGPARDAGLRVEAGLADLIITDVHRATADDDRAGRLPLVSHVLAATWTRRTHATLTVAGYRAVGGVAGSVSQAAEDAWARLDDPGRAVARSVLMSLVHLYPGGATTVDTDKAALIASFDDTARVRKVVDHLTDARLVTVSADRVGLVHESLLVAWPRLAEWIDRDAEIGPLRQRVLADARAWDAHGRQRHFLHVGARLAQAAPLLDDRDRSTGPRNRLLDAFLAASVRRDRRIRRVRRGVTASIAVLLVVVSGVAAYAVLVGQQAVEARGRAESIGLLATADSLRADDPSTSAYLAAAAYLDRPDDDALARLYAGETMPIAGATEAHRGTVYDVAVSPRGDVVASIGYDRAVRLWRMEPGSGTLRAAAAIPDAHGVFGTSVAIDRAGTLLATAGGDGAVRLFDISDPSAPRERGRVRTVGPAAYLVRFAPAGSALAVATDAGRAQVWDVSDPDAPRQVSDLVTGDGAAVRAVAWSPDARTLATGGDDRVTRLWDVTTPDAPRLRTVVAADIRRTVHALAFSPDGTRLAVGDDDPSVLVYRLDDGPTPRPVGAPIVANTDAVWSVMFAPDSRTLAVGSYDGTIRRWDTDDVTREIGQPMSTTSGAVAAIAYTPDGSRIVAGGSDGRIRVWRPPPTPVLVHDGAIAGLAVARSAGVAATVGTDGRLRLSRIRSDPPTLAPLSSLEIGVSDAEPDVAVRDDGALTAVAGGAASRLTLYDTVNPADPRNVGSSLPLATRYLQRVGAMTDGHLVVADSDYSVRVVDVRDPARMAWASPSMVGPGSFVESIATSVDGRAVHVGFADGSIRSWDVTDAARPRPARVLLGHRGRVRSLGVSGDGRVLISGGDDQTLRVWDLASGTGSTLSVPAAVGALALSPDGSTVAAATADAGVRLFRTAGAAALGPVSTTSIAARSAGATSEVAFDSRGGLVAAAGPTVALWSLDGRADLARICAGTAGTVTAQRWKALATGSIPQPTSCG